MAQSTHLRSSPPSYSHSSPCQCRSDGSDNLPPKQIYGTLDQETLLPKHQGPRYPKLLVISVLLLGFVLGFFSNERLASFTHVPGSLRSRIAWEGLDAAPQCLRYGTREYTSTLTNIPLGFDAIKECKNKPMYIHGKRLFPDRCEDGVCGLHF
jgi:hypothetical protein